MTSVMLAFFAIAIMLILIFVQMPVGFSMAAVGIVGYAFLESWAQSLSIVKIEVAEALTNMDMAVIPLFLLMGSFANLSGVSEDLYRLGNAILGRFRGGLAMASITGCGMFGTICGSSFATTATFGRIAVPQMLNRGYSKELASGCIASGGNLGAMVPPSITLVIYAVMTEQGIIDLFKAAILPALLLIALFFLTCRIYVQWKPQAGPPGDKASLSDIWKAVKIGWRGILLIALMIVGIYGGLFTVHEVASLGAVLSFILALFSGKFTLERFWEALIDTAATAAMMYTMLIGASIFNYFIVISNLPNFLVGLVVNADLPVYVVLAILLVMYIILGSIFDTIAAFLVTLPFVFPLIIDMGFSPIWWGIINLMIIEIGVITPPIGMNVFVLKGVLPNVEMHTIFKGVTPFTLASMVCLLIVMVFPSLCLFLVNHL